MASTDTDPNIPKNPYERMEEMQPVLDEASAERVASYGCVRHVPQGEVLFDVGDHHTDFILVRSGKLAIELDGCRETTTIVEHGPGAFSGEIDMFSNRRAIVRGRCTQAGEMAFLDRAAFRRMLATNAELSETIVRAFILRRMGLIYQQHGDLTLLGDPEHGELVGLRTFLTRNGHPHRAIDPRENPDEAQAVMSQFDLAAADLPAAIYRNKEVLRRPTPRKVADFIGLSSPSGETEIYDVAVVGAGPAGLAAAVNAAAEGLSVIAIESRAPGGQAGTSSKIENYPAFPTGISGQALGARMMLQAQKFGTEIITPRRVTSIQCEDSPFCLRLDDEEDIHARAIVVATGATWRRLNLPNEERLENTGVYYGATAVEAMLCRGADVVVVGGGNSAGQAAIYLARQARSVQMLIRGKQLAEGMSAYLIQRIEATPNITLHYCTEVSAIEGEEHVKSLRLRNRETGDERSASIRHLFVMIGARPNTAWLNGCLLLDDRGR